MRKTRVGFIGAGIIAARHLGNLAAFDDVTVAAISDVASARAAEAAQPFGAAVYSDYAAMLHETALDAVYICVPPFAHGPLELAVIEHKLPFFVEKPLSVDLAVAEQIARAVEAQQVVTAVGYHWRYLDTTERAQSLLQDNPARLALGYWLDGTPPPPWWVKEAQSGGQMVEQTTHIFDLARLLVGEVETVYAEGSRLNRAEFPTSDVDDVSVATLRFASGAVGTMASTCLLRWPHRIGLHLFAEGMALEMTEFELMVDVGQGRPVQKAKGDPFVREDRDFIDAAQGKSNNIRTTYGDALRTHRLVCRAREAAQAGQPLSVAEEVERV